jgi:large subunit ribosomal protein L23
MSKILPLKPRLSEKTYTLSESRVYVMDVPASANKYTVSEAVEAQFEVKVSKIRMANIKGKSKRVMSLTGKRYSNNTGRRNGVKKAYVTLAEGNSLPFFAAIEEEQEKEEKTQKQLDKAMDKQTAKEAKQSKPRLSGLRRGKKETDEENK